MRSVVMSDKLVLPKTSRLPFTLASAVTLKPETSRVPPTLASAVTLKPVPLVLLKVNVPAISAVLFASR